VDLKRELQIAVGWSSVGTVGLQPRATESVGTAGLLPGAPDRSGHCRASTHAREKHSKWQNKISE